MVEHERGSIERRHALQKCGMSHRLGTETDLGHTRSVASILPEYCSISRGEDDWVQSSVATGHAVHVRAAMMLRIVLVAASRAVARWYETRLSAFMMQYGDTLPCCSAPSVQSN